MHQSSHTRVLIVGAGPSGLAAAKYALQAGMQPTVLERRPDLGGVWHPQYGFTWENMVTNLSKFSCSFSDFPWAPGTDMLPRSKDFFAYLKRYAQHFHVTPHIRFGCEVTAIRKVHKGEEGAYSITWK